MTSTSTEEQMRNEIARLTGKPPTRLSFLLLIRLLASINQAKSGQPSKPPSASRYPPRHNTYVNPTYKPPSHKYAKPQTSVLAQPTRPPVSTSKPTSQVKEVVLGGVAFKSSARSLVRKDLPQPSSTTTKTWAQTTTPDAPVNPYKPSGKAHPTSRPYKSKVSARARRGRNMTLNNTTRAQGHQSAKRMKFSNRPCPRFATTGVCNRGLTCAYQHDPNKIAICWSFLQGNCPNTTETCNLSHDPTPERTPLCLHFLNHGRCTRENCPFPHANVGTRQGVCRDFAVLGFCDRGLDCDKQHVRECPDFAEKGSCSQKGCKLPHVIRANRNRKPTVANPVLTSTGITLDSPMASVDTSEDMGLQRTVADAQLGDEFISLTFNESDSEEESEDDDDDDSDDADDNDDTEQPAEGSES